MRNITSVFRKALYDGNRNYQCTAYITLLDNTELTITNARIAQGGVSLDDNVSDTSSFTALGSAIINALTLRINNIYEEYSAYDFTGASLVLYISLTGVQEQPIKICTMTVEKVSYDGMLITLECLDDMSNFDKPYTSTLIYPATLQSIINDACTECGVTLATATFPNYTFEIATKPNNEALTYREVVSYVATLAGCFARCNSNGALELKWFDKSALVAIENTINGGVFDEDSPYSTGDSVNGGVFNPWNVGDEADGGLFTDNINAHYITALSSQNLGTDDVVITGVQITVENEVVAGEETRTDVITRTYGTDDYVIKIENNPFITLTNMDTIGTFLQNQLAGLTFRYGTISHLNDPSIEAGDVAMVWDRKGNAYPLLITNTQFKVGSYQTTTCSADTPAKNSSTRFSALTKSFVKTKNVVEKESNSLERKLNNAINSKSGMYETREPVGTSGAYIYYMHDKPNLSESSAVIKITNEAVAVTPNYQQLPEPDWYGLTVDGNFIANIMSVIGIDFDWGTGGTLTLGGQNNINGALTVLNANGNTIGMWNNEGIRLFDGSNNIVGQFAVGINSETQIGKNSTSHIYMDYHSLQLIDKNSTIYFYVSDLRDMTGTVLITAFVISTGVRQFNWGIARGLPIPADYTNIEKVSINGVETSNYTTTNNWILFDDIVPDGAEIELQYYVKNSAPAYTLGNRADGILGLYSLAVGYLGIAAGTGSFSGGYGSIAKGPNSFAFGYLAEATGQESFSVGFQAQALENGAIALGSFAKATANASFAEGSNTTASNKMAHAEGFNTIASGYASHAQNAYTIAASRNQTAIGKFNIEDLNDTYSVIIGNGTSRNNRSNTMMINWNGGLFLRGTTGASNAYTSENPKLEFQNSAATQNLALIFTDYDSVQAPASLTLAGNQGGEYFIAPNIKVTSGLEVGAAKFYLPSEVTATKSGSYITSGSITVRRRGNVAHIYGNITIGSAVASQTTIATIPDGYRPITTDFFSATNGSFFRVNSDGTIQAQNALTAGNYYFSTTYPLA